MSHIGARAFVAIVACIVGGIMLTTCKRDTTSSLKGQTNTTITFYGIALDQDGAPLEGAMFEYQVDAYPKDWTFDTRGRPYDVTTVTTTSDKDGKFQFTATGCILRRLRVGRSGYRHFFEQDESSLAPSTHGYSLISWGDVSYRSDPGNPAVFIFVRGGAKEISALPSHGGARAYGKRWIPHKAAWPKNPSLKDVIYKEPTTLPHNEPATKPGQ